MRVLIELGTTKLNDPVSVYWPDTGKCYIRKSITEIAVDCNTFKAIDTLVNASRLLCTRNEHQRSIDVIIGAMLQPEILTALTQCDGLRTPRKPTTSFSKASSDTYQSWNEQCLDPEVRQHKFRDFVRRLLSTREARYFTNSPEWTTLYDLLDWSLIPDDIIISILRLREMDISSLLQSMQEGIGDSRLGYARKSSRVLLELADLAWRRNAMIKFIQVLRGFCGKHGRLDVAINETLVHVSLLAYGGNTVSLQALPALEQHPGIEVLPQSCRLARFSDIVSAFSWIKAMPQGASISKVELFHAARCYRTCRFDARRANRMYVDLKDIGDNYDLSLNFPSGYMEINGRHVVKISIVLAIYRWNYRLRRKNNRPFSDSDIAYAKSVELPIPQADDGLDEHLK